MRLRPGHLAPRALATALLILLAPPPAADGADDPESPEVWMASEASPEPLVRQALPCLPDSARAPGDRRATVQMMIGADGFVTAARCNGLAPRDSAAVVDAATQWIFRPPIFRPMGSTTGTAVPVWLAIPIPDCGPPEQRYGSARLTIARPGSVMRERWERADSARAFRLVPPSQANFDRVRVSSGHIDALEGSWILAARAVDTESTRTALGRLLADARAYQGADPIARRCLPEPEFAIRLGVERSPDAVTVLVSFACDFLQVRSADEQVLAPFAPLRRRVLALARAAFPDDPAFTR